MSIRFTLTKARAKLADIVADAQYGGKITIITRHGKDAAAVVPVTFVEVEGPESKKAPTSVLSRTGRRKAKA